MNAHLRRCLITLAIAGSLPLGAASAAVTLLGTGAIAGTATDQSGFTGLLEDGVTLKNQIGGFGSAFAYTGRGQRFVAAPDRGPADGATTYVDRLYRIDIGVRQVAPYGSNAFQFTPAVTDTLLLSDEAGRPFTGSSTAFDPTGSTASLRLDPEGIRVDACGTTAYVSDEYGPYLYAFDLATGRRRGAIKLPTKLLIDAPSATPASELNGNAFGRQSNRGMEGLAISPDGSKLYGLMQNALIQDGALGAGNARISTGARLVEVTLATGALREFYYPLDAASYGLNEILAINDHTFLVIERDGRAGAAAQFKRIFRIDIAGASDIRAVKSLPSTGVPADIVPVTKTPFLDLLDPAYGLAGAGFPEKIEGLAFGPNLPSGQHSLLVTSDNDFAAGQPSKIYVFGIDPSDLPGYQPQQFRNCP
ncbi:MAG: pyruvate-binding protein [Xanthomonadaceae bacterium]|nr:pyruvate-binding protein [Xanthomonadaceae bacterium]